MPATRPKASRVNFWGGIPLDQAASVSDADLTVWAGRGAKGWDVGSTFLRDFGGGHNYLVGQNADILLTNSNIGNRIRTQLGAGSQSTLSFWIESYWGPNLRAPGPGDWYDDSGWTTFCTRATELTAAASRHGFTQISIDGEDYPGDSGGHTWHWSYAGNTHTKAEVKQKAFDRGAQFMTALLAGFPSIKLHIYTSSFRFSNFDAAGLIQKYNYGQGAGNFDDATVLDFIAGMLSSEGYSFIQFLDPDFYKVAHLPSSTFAEVETWAVNQFFSDFSKRCTNWLHASQRLHWTPFSMIDEDGSEFYEARPASTVSTMLSTARDIATDTDLWIFQYGGFPNGNWTAPTASYTDPEDYLPAIAAAAVPGDVTDPAPTVTVTSGSLPVGGTISGQATAHWGVRRLWVTAPGGATTAIPHEFVPLSPLTKAVAATLPAGSPSFSLAGLTWRAEWTANGVAAGSTVTVEDVHGNTATAGTLGGAPAATVVAGRGAGARVMVPSTRR